jgi:anaerobic ribonucleoside-triphosphate reductase activating protein
VSRDTWSDEGGTSLSVTAVLDWLTEMCDTGEVDGVTISGGEPSEQPESLRLLVEGIGVLRRRGAFTGDILCYTGLEEAEFHQKCPWACNFIDAIITGRFQITEPTSLLWRGSANQRLIPLTERGRRTYQEYVDATTSEPQMQFSVSDGQVWMIGLPGRGDLQRLQKALRNDGVTLKEVSWQPR